MPAAWAAAWRLYRRDRMAWGRDTRVTWWFATRVASGVRMWHLILLRLMLCLLHLMPVLGGCCGWDPEIRGLGGAGAGRWRDAAAAGAGVVRGDAGGLAPAAGGAAAERAADRGPGPPG